MTSTWEYSSISLSDGEIFIKTKGKGRNVLLCLHGYMQDKDAFDLLFYSLPKGWRVICVDLPLFGKTQWYDLKKEITSAFLNEFWEALHRMAPDGIFHLVGFSMGGLVTLGIQTAVSSPAKRIILIAPDGIRRNPFHQFALRTWVGKASFGMVIKYADNLLGLAKALFDIRLIPTGAYLFFKHHFEDREKRELLWAYMNLYRGIRISYPTLRKKTKANATKWDLIWGENDMIISPKAASSFMHKMDMTTLHWIDGGHNVIREKPKAVASVIFGNHISV